MGKVNKSIRAKAKKAVAKVKRTFPRSQMVHRPDKSTLKGEAGRQHAEDKIDLVLHKTNSPAKRSITKKEKFRQKHKNLMNKFALIKKQRKQEQARKNREKTAVVGDLKPLKDALPSLDELFKLSKSKESIKTGLQEFDENDSAVKQKISAKQKLQRKKNKFINQVTSYQALLQDADFKKNPRDVISYHIKYTHGLADE